MLLTRFRPKTFFLYQLHNLNGALVCKNHLLTRHHFFCIGHVMPLRNRICPYCSQPYLCPSRRSNMIHSLLWTPPSCTLVTRVTDYPLHKRLRVLSPPHEPACTCYLPLQLFNETSRLIVRVASCQIGMSRHQNFKFLPNLKDTNYYLIRSYSNLELLVVASVRIAIAES